MAVSRPMSRILATVHLFLGKLERATRPICSDLRASGTNRQSELLELLITIIYEVYVAMRFCRFSGPLELPLHGLAGLKRPHRCVQALDALAEVVGASGQRRKGAEVHGNYFLRAQQSAGEGGLARAHGEEVADGQERQFRVVKLFDQRHIGEDVGIAREIERPIVGEAQDVSGGLSPINDPAFVEDAATVDRKSTRLN